MLTRANRLTLAAALAAVAVTGCYSPDGRPDNTATGALTGGAFGAATGAILGGRHAGEGALIGAAAGSILGGLIGHSADQEQERRLRMQAPDTYSRAQQGVPLSLVDVKALSKAGVNDDTIIAQVSNSHTVYHLNATDILDLHAAGVSQRVIDFLINTQTTFAAAPMQSVVNAPPPAPVAEPVLVAPGADYVWVGGEWVWNGRWVWVAGYWDRPLYPNAVWVGGYWERGPYGWRRVEGHWRR